MATIEGVYNSTGGVVIDFADLVGDWKWDFEIVPESGARANGLYRLKRLHRH